MACFAFSFISVWIFVFHSGCALGAEYGSLALRYLWFDWAGGHYSKRAQVRFKWNDDCMVDDVSIACINRRRRRRAAEDGTVQLSAAKWYGFCWGKCINSTAVSRIRANLHSALARSCSKIASVPLGARRWSGRNGLGPIDRSSV